jgi:hypothetical protein
VRCDPNSLLQTQLGKVNLRQFDLGELLVRSADSEWRRILTIPIPASVIVQSPPVRRTVTNVSAGYEVSISGEVSQRIKAEIEQEIRGRAVLLVLNYTRRRVDQEYIIQQLNGVLLQKRLRAAQTPWSEADQKIYVVSEVVAADSLESSYDGEQKISGGVNSSELVVSGLSIRVKNQCFGKMTMSAARTPLLFELIPVLWNPTSRTVVVDASEP